MGTDPRIVRYLPVLEGDVEVHPHQNLLVPDVPLVKRLQSHREHQLPIDEVFVSPSPGGFHVQDGREVT